MILFGNQKEGRGKDEFQDFFGSTVLSDFD
jgi:hypothetical protein